MGTDKNQKKKAMEVTFKRTGCTCALLYEDDGLIGYAGQITNFSGPRKNLILFKNRQQMNKYIELIETSPVQGKNQRYTIVYEEDDPELQISKAIIDDRCK